jgi:serine/threonine protein kinase
MRLDLCSGGEMFDRICRKGHFSELDASFYLTKIMKGLQALHRHNVLHLDVKPENLLFATTDEHAELKICDFGLSQMTEEKKKNEQNGTGGGGLNGTVGYMAPELIDENRTSPACDVWGAGVVLFVMLVGYPPFWGESDEEILERTRRGRLHMFDSDWKLISDSARNLVLRMLNVDFSKRISSDDVLQHPWIALNGGDATGGSGPNDATQKARPAASVPKENPQVPSMSRDPSPPSPSSSGHPSPADPAPRDVDLGATKRRMKQYFVHYKTRNRLVNHNHSSNARAFSHSVSSPLANGGGPQAKSFIHDFMEKEKVLFEEDFMSVGLKASSSIGITLYTKLYKHRGPKLPVGPFFDLVDQDRDGYVTSSDMIHCIDRILKCDDEFIGMVFDVYADEDFDVTTVCDGYESDLRKRNDATAAATQRRENGETTITMDNVLRVYAMISGTDPMLESNQDLVNELYAGIDEEVVVMTFDEFKLNYHRVPILVDMFIQSSKEEYVQRLLQHFQNSTFSPKDLDYVRQSVHEIPVSPVVPPQTNKKAKSTPKKKRSFRIDFSDLNVSPL